METMFNILGTVAIVFYVLVPFVIICAIALDRTRKRRR